MDNKTSGDSLLIKNTSVLPMTKKDDLILNGYIYVHSGEIADVGHEPHPDLYQSASRIIDGEDMVAIPGLINGHTHTPMSLLRGYSDDLPLMDWLRKVWAIENQMNEEDMYWASMLSMAEMLKSGSTTFSDMYYGMDRIAEGVDHVGIRALLAQGIIEDGSNGKSHLSAAVSFVENWSNYANGNIQALIAPHAPYTCSPDLIKKIVDESVRLNCSIHTHLAETRDEMKIINEKYRMSPVALMEKIGLFTRPVIAAHGVYLNEVDKEILEKNQVGLIYNPKSNMKLASGIAPISSLLNKGIAVGLGTDGAASNNVLDMFEEMRFASLLQKVNLEDPTVLPAYQTLELATRLGAKAIGIEDRVGILEVGKRADITLVDLRGCHLTPNNNIISHLVYATKAEDVAYTIVDGRILLDQRRLMTIDEEEMMWNILRIKNKLLS